MTLISPGTHRGSILVLTQEDDVTAELVIDKLREDGEPVVRVDTSAFPLETEFSASYRAREVESRLTLPKGEQVDFSEVRSVWNRRPGTFSFPPGLSRDSLKFAKGEAHQALAGVMHTSKCLWVNSPERDSLARYKPLQLRVAQEIGLTIPDTVISTSSSKVRSFIEEHEGNVVYKRLSSSTLYDEHGRATPHLTTKLTDELIERLDHIATTPCLFQENLAKAYELRVTIVDGFISAARVDSQQRPDTQIDWRVGVDLPWSPYTLPAAVERQLRAMMDRFGLLFGAVDLVVTQRGEYVFLEVNPVGQWAWFQDEITLPIRDAIARLLADGSPEGIEGARERVGFSGKTSTSGTDS